MDQLSSLQAAMFFLLLVQCRVLCTHDMYLIFSSILQVGKAMAIAGLDMTETNPWSRLTNSEHTSLHGLKEWVRRYIRGLRGLPRGMPNRAQVAARQVNKETRAQGLVSLNCYINFKTTVFSCMLRKLRNYET